MPSERILLIEDDATIVAGLELNLSLDGYDVVTASDGQTGLRLAEETSPDLVLLDIMLPKINGLEVLRRLRRSDPDLAVLILSARGEETAGRAGANSGAHRTRQRSAYAGVAGRQVEGSTRAPRPASPAMSITDSCVVPEASSQPFTIWMRCRSVPGRPGLPGSLRALARMRGAPPAGAAPSSPPMGTPAA